MIKYNGVQTDKTYTEKVYFTITRCNRFPMRKLLYITFLVLFCLTVAQADTIVLKSGETFTTQKAWQHGGKLKFYMRGILVSVPLADVAQVLDKGSQGQGQPQTQAPEGSSSEREAEQRSLPTPVHSIDPPLSRPVPVHANVPDDPSPIPGASLPPLAAPKSPPGSPPSRPAPPRPNESGDPSVANHTAEPKIPDPTRLRKNQQHGDGIGFFGLQWGMKVSQITGIQKIRSNPAYGGVEEYAITDDSLHWGKARFSGVVLSFWHGMLYTLTAWVDGYPAYDHMKAESIRRFGEGTQRRADVERRIWVGSETERMLEFDETLNTGLLWMRSTQIHARVEQSAPP